MDEALHLPPMNKPGALDDLLSSRDEQSIRLITPLQAPQYNASHRPKKEKSEAEEEEEDGGDDTQNAQQSRGHQLSSPDSTDSNDFIKLEKPNEQQHHESSASVQKGDLGKIEPIDHGAVESEKKPATTLHSGMQPYSHEAQEKYETLMATATDIAHRVERDMESLLQREKPKSGYRNIDDEAPIRREGPLTLGQRVETKPLHFDSHRGLTDSSRSPAFGDHVRSTADEAASAVGEFSSKVKHRSDEGGAKSKAATADLLDFGETTPNMVSDVPIPQRNVLTSPERMGSARGWRLFSFKNWDPRALDLIYWRNPRKSGIVFGTTLLLLLAFSYFNVVSVVSYLGLIILSATLGYRVYTSVTAAVNKTVQRNPFQQFLEKPVDLQQDRAHDHVDTVLKNVRELISHLRRLFLVEDVKESIKFGVFLWALTYVGEYVTGTCLVILAFIGLFTLPKIYELYQPQIDNYYNMAEQKVKPVLDNAKQKMDKVPYLSTKKPATTGYQPPVTGHQPGSTGYQPSAASSFHPPTTTYQHSAKQE